MTTTDKGKNEIDLLDLFTLIYKGVKELFQSFIKWILYLIIFCVKKALYITGFIVIGGIVGYAYHSFSTPTFKSGMVVQPNGIPSTELIDYMNDLTAISQSLNKNTLSTALNIPDSSAQKVKSIEAFPYIDVNGDEIGDYIDFNRAYSADDTTMHIVHNRCYISFELIDNYPKEYLQEGVLFYILKNEYMNKLNTIQKNELKEQIQQTINEIAILDSLQNKEYFEDEKKDALPTVKEGTVIYAEKDKKLYYQHKFGLTDRKQELEKEYDLIQGPITVIKNISEVAIEQNTKSSIMIKFGIWFGVIGTIALLCHRFKLNFIKYVS